MLYRTGDLARRLPTGAIEFMGRRDDQIKIRGYRIELVEIQVALEAIPEISMAYVRKMVNAEADPVICAYVVTDNRHTEDHEWIKSNLRTKLPEYMIPTAFVSLEKMPLTVNGKVDIRALPAPKLTASLNKKYVAPETETEILLAQIWQELLGAEKIDRFSNFFELGGHSLLAVRLVSRIRIRCDVEIGLKKIFEYPTLDQLALIIETNKWSTKNISAELEDETEREEIEI